MEDDIPDSEPLELKPQKKSDSFVTILGDLFSKINFKMAILILVIFIIIMSDTFNDFIMLHFDGAIERGEVTMYGHIVQGIFLVLFYIIIDVLIKAGYI